MAKIFIGNNGYKLMLGNTKIRRAYLGRDLIYSGDVTVCYHISNTESYSEPVEEGDTCLSPKSFNPDIRAGYTFLGWRLDNEASSDVLTELKAGEDDIHLYGVYYQEFTVNFYNASTTPITKKYKRYINQSNIVNPKTETGDTALNDVSGYNIKLGWCTTKAKTSTTPVKNYNNNEIITVTDNMNLYSLYSKNVNATVVNGKGTGTESKPISGIRYKQYNTAEVTVNPSITLDHKDVPGWDPAGWSTDSSGKPIDTNIKDGKPFVMTDRYDGKVISAIYTQAVTFTAFNANGPDVYNEIRTKVCLTTGVNVTDPEIDLSHDNYTDWYGIWNNAGWSTTTDDATTVKFSDGKFKITADYDDKSIYALYNKNTSITIVNGNNKIITNDKLTRYIKFISASSSKVIHPEIDLSHDNIGTDWKSGGWNIIKNNKNKTINDGKFTVTDTYDGKELYALYTKAVTVYVANVNAKTKESLIRTVQYNGETFTDDPSVTLKHGTYEDYTSAGWNTTANNVTADTQITENSFKVKSVYDNKTFYALYKKEITINTYNYKSATTSIKDPKTGIRYKQFKNGSSSVYTYNPRIELAHKTYTGWENANWNIAKTIDINSAIKDNPEFEITSEYDGKEFYALYKKKVTVKMYNGSVTATTPSPALYRYQQFNTSVKTQHPTLTLTETLPDTSWKKFGWNTTAGSFGDRIADNTEVTITTDSVSYYSLYTKAITIDTYNYNKSTGKGTKDPKTGTRYIQYNTKQYVIDPEISLSHNTYTGWTSNGWNTTKGTVKKSDIDERITDGAFKVTSEYDNKTFYALYSNGSIVATIVDVSGTKTENLGRTVQFSDSNPVYDNPEVVLTHDGYYYNGYKWKNNGWNCTAGDYNPDPTIQDNKVLKLTESKTFYALYKKDGISATVYNYNNIKTSYSGLVRIVQFTTSGMKTKDPTINTVHTPVNGWNKSGWNNTVDNYEAISDITDSEEFKLTDKYDGKSFYAIYSKNITLYIYNGSTTRETINNLKRHVQYHGTTYTHNPLFTVDFKPISGWTAKGWYMEVNPTSINTNYIISKTFTVTETYDGETLYSLYSKNVTITVVNKDNNVYDRTGIRYKQFNTKEYVIDPKVSINHDTYTDWDPAGWTTNDKGDSAKDMSADINIAEPTFKVTSAYDNKKIYAIYSYDITVRLYNASSTAETKDFKAYTKYTATGTNPTKIWYDKLELTEKSIGSDWSPMGWNTTKGSVTKQYNDDVTIEMKPVENGKSYYSLYSKEVSITLYQNNNVTETKSSTRAMQYNSNTSPYVYNYPITISHSTKTGWDPAGWNTTKTIDRSKVDSNIKDGEFTITSSYEGKALYALYKKKITVTVVNYNAKSTDDLYRYKLYTGTEVSSDPEVSLSHNPYTGWTADGWSYTNGDVEQKIDDGKVSVAENKSFYAIYLKDVFIYAYNGSKIRTPLKLVRRTQFNNSSSSPYTKNPELSLSQIDLYNWDIVGWTTTLNKTTKDYDSSFTKIITSSLDGTTFYSIYKQNANLTICNGCQDGGVAVTIYNADRMRQYNSSIYTVNPKKPLTHYAISGWKYNGWNFGNNNTTPVIANDNEQFEMTPEYDNKPLHALYKYDVTVKWVESSTVSSTTTGTRYLRAGDDGNWHYTNPSFSRNVPSLTGFTILGWTSNTGAPSVADYNSGASFTRQANTTLYALYKKTVTVYVHTSGVIIAMDPKDRYYNKGTSADNIPKFTVGDQDPVAGRTFLGWSLDTSPTIIYQHFTDVPCMDDTHIYAVWHQSDQIFKDYRNEPNGYKSFYPDTQETFQRKIYRLWLFDVDTDWFDKLEFHIRVEISPGKWAGGTWSYGALFLGTVPDMNNQRMSGQPENVELRAINWQNPPGEVKTDRGPCANGVEAVLTRDIKPTTGRGALSEISHAFIEDWYVSGTRLDIWTITGIGRTRTW